MVYNDYSNEAATIIQHGMTEVKNLLTAGKQLFSLSPPHDDCAHNSRIRQESSLVCRNNCTFVQPLIRRIKLTTFSPQS